MPNEDLKNEIEALNSIYGDDTLTTTSENHIFVLRLRNSDTSLRIEFPDDYPNAPPAVLGVNSSGEHSKRGEAAHLLDVFRDAVGRLYQPGEVCLYDVLEDNSALLEKRKAEEQTEERDDLEVHDFNDDFDTSAEGASEGEAPPWTLSDVLIENKSVFIARCAPCTSPAQAQVYLSHLLATDKKVAKATHNITAHRIRGPNGTSFQDCDDDGESAAGGRLLHLMQLMDLWEVCVVVTRWYGGEKLGPKRFGCINGVARDAFVKAGLVKDEDGGGKGKKGKK